VPSLGALNKAGDASVTSVSCASAGNCAAGWDYADHHGSRDQGFVAVERNGRWGAAIEVPGLGALNKAGDAGVGSVSCVSAGNCAVGGDRGGSEAARQVHQQGFVAVQRDGRWARARKGRSPARPPPATQGAARPARGWRRREGRKEHS